MYGGLGAAVGASSTLAGVATIASLPNTGGSRGVVAYVAMTSIVLGLVIVASTVARLVAKRHFNA